MLNNLIGAFPDKYTPNQQQIKLLKNIEQAFDDGYKFVVCAAPTGSGKSFVSKTLGNASDSVSSNFTDLVMSYLAYKRTPMGGYAYEDELNNEKAFGAFALTITKSLQDQYQDLFPDVMVLKGKSNYQCAVDEAYTVEYAPCLHSSKLKEECWAKNKCPYYNSRNKALVSSFTTLNYNMFFALPKHVKKRQYIICDEASELEDQIVKEFSIKVNFEFLAKCEISVSPFPGGDYGKIGRWLSGVSISINDRIEDLQEIISSKSSKISQSYVNDRRMELVSLKNVQNKISAIIETWNDSEYLYERDAKGISFTPLKINNLTRHLFDYADRVILMSATIIDPSNFCKTLGIDKFKYIEADSTFDPEKAPIYVQTKTKLNFSNLNQNLPKLKKQIEDICKLHSQDKGIIHTHSNHITEYLRNNISDSRILFREPGVNNEALMDRHLNTDEPTVLASPSMSHGIDLKDDLARFQIIIKAPYLPTVDKRVERMMKLDFSWYLNKMLSSLIQACGRGIRSHKDHCITYILDAAVIEQVIKCKHKLPKYFLDRFV